MIIYGIIFFLLILACFLCLYRIGVGPTAPDRSVAMDIAGHHYFDHVLEADEFYLPSYKK